MTEREYILMRNYENLHMAAEAMRRVLPEKPLTEDDIKEVTAHLMRLRDETHARIKVR